MVLRPQTSDPDSWASPCRDPPGIAIDNSGHYQWVVGFGWHALGSPERPLGRQCRSPSPRSWQGPPWPSKRCRGRRILEDLGPSSPCRHAHHQPRTQVRRDTSGGSCLCEQYPVTSLGRVSGSGRSGAGCPRPARPRRPGPPSLLGFDLPPRPRRGNSGGETPLRRVLSAAGNIGQLPSR